MINILFLYKKDLSPGILTFQKNMLQLFGMSGNFNPIVIYEQVNFKNDLINNIYRFIDSLRFIHILIDYIVLITQIKKSNKNIDYLYIPHYYKYGFLAIITHAFFKVPFIVPILGWEEKEMKSYNFSKARIFLVLKYESWVCKKAKYILTSEDLKEEYSKKFRKDKFLITDAPIDTDRFKPVQINNFLQNRLNKKIILTALTISGAKADGLKLLIEAFLNIKTEYANVMLLIAGDGDRKNELEKLVIKLKLEDDIKFLGHCNNMTELINSSDIFCLIFNFGCGIGSAVKEAMACEKPCVLSNTPGTQILENGKEILLINYEVDDIAKKIVYLLKEEKVAHNIGIAARKRVERNYSITAIEKILTQRLIS